MKLQASQKMRDLMGSNPLRMIERDEHLSMCQKQKQGGRANRVSNYMNSNGMQASLAYKGNDETYGKVDTKAITSQPIVAEKKDVWAPKASGSRIVSGNQMFFAE